MLYTKRTTYGRKKGQFASISAVYCCTTPSKVLTLPEHCMPLHLCISFFAGDDKSVFTSCLNCPAPMIQN